MPKIARVVVCELFNGSWITFPNRQCEVHEVRHVAGSDPQAERVTAEGCTVEKLGGRPHRGHRRQLVDHRALGRVRPQYGEQSGGVIRSFAAADRRLSALGGQVEHLRTGLALDRQIEMAVAVGLRFGQLPRNASPGGP